MTWPVPKEQELDDYVSAPGDAVCGITAGSCAPRDTPHNAVVPALAPAPYSARGPVAAGVHKPDVTIEEGNLLPNGTQIGLPTMRPNGDIRTDSVGTSFATPVVASIGAELRSCLALGAVPFGPSQAGPGARCQVTVLRC
jgi:serine protease AprX